jgi:hypothetical protein
MISAAAAKNLMVLLESVLADATTDPPPGRPAAVQNVFIFTFVRRFHYQILIFWGVLNQRLHLGCIPLWGREGVILI